MDDATRILLNATIRLAEAGAALRDAAQDIEQEMAKTDKMVGRLIDIAKARQSDWDARAKSDFASLSARVGIAQRSSGAVRRSQTEALGALGTEYRNFADIADRYAEVASALQIAHRKRRSRELALTRIAEGVIRNRWTGEDAAGEAYETPETSHSYITIALDRFVDLLLRTGTLLRLDPVYASAGGGTRKARFLEVGCGPGRIVVAAREARIIPWESLHGFDLNPDLVEAGRAGLGLTDELFVADALTVDYAPYDIIFSYRPLFDLDMQAELEARMVETMHPGAYLLAPYALDLDRYEALDHVGDDLEIWRKREAG